MLSDFWNRIVQIALLAAPVILMLLGIDIIPALDSLGDIILVLIPSIIIAVKDFLVILNGWRAAAFEGLSFKEYRKATPARIYNLRLKNAA